MIRMVCVCLCFFFLVSGAVGEEWKDFSMDDVIAGFKKKNLFYSEFIFQNEKYLRAFNKCLSSRPADFDWMKKYCKKDTVVLNPREFR